MPGTVQLILPGLFDLPLQELERDFLRDELDGLNRVLSRAGSRANQAFTIDTILHQALGWLEFTQAPARSLPVAQALAPSQSIGAYRHLLFEAVHLKPNLHNAVFIPIEKNENNLQDINNIINDLHELFKVDCDISVAARGVYLIRLSGFDAPSHYPHPLSVLGKPANTYIEQSRAILPWYKLVNEMQMFLHQHPINQRRLEQGLLPVNSLWFWGGGGPPGSIEPGLGWYCDDKILNRFALGLGLQPLPLSAIDADAFRGDAIVIDLGLMEALKSGRAAALDERLLEIDRRLFEPLLAATSAQHGRLILRAGSAVDFELGAIAGIKFWRRHRSLLDYAIDADDL